LKNDTVHGTWPAIALDTLSLIWALLFFPEVFGIAMASTGVAGG
jgi:hypothetical protein